MRYQKEDASTVTPSVVTSRGSVTLIARRVTGSAILPAQNSVYLLTDGGYLFRGALDGSTAWVCLNNQHPLGRGVDARLHVAAMVEVLAVRPFARQGSNAWLMSTVALGIVLDNLVMHTFGKEPRSLPSPLAQSSIELGGMGLGVYPLHLLIPAIGLALAALLHTISRRTRWGTALLAVVQNRDAARLMGIPITRAIAVAFALSTLLAGVAGVLIGPLFNVNADMGTLFGLKAFAVAILGGITSAWGVMIAGLLFGMAEALITATLGSGYTQIITFALVIAVLAIRPNGLFGRAQVKKV